jgi:hypothetical protein
VSGEDPSALEASGHAADESFDDAPVGSGAQPCPRPPTEPSLASSWIEIVLLGEDDRPIVGERYRIELRDGSAIEGRIGSTGLVRVEGIEPGDCVVSFPRLDASAWEPAAGAKPS